MAELSNTLIKEQRDAAFQFRGQLITYREKSDSLDVTTGVITPSNSDTIIGTGMDGDPGVLTSTVSDRQVLASGNKYQVGDRLFQVRHDDMPETPPKTTSVIIFNSDTYEIISHNQSPDGNTWIIQGRMA